jgi:hypothetical protein
MVSEPWLSVMTTLDRPDLQNENQLQVLAGAER